MLTLPFIVLENLWELEVRQKAALDRFAKLVGTTASLGDVLGKAVQHVTGSFISDIANLEVTH